MIPYSQQSRKNRRSNNPLKQGHFFQVSLLLVEQLMSPTSNQGLLHKIITHLATLTKKTYLVGALLSKELLKLLALISYQHRRTTKVNLFLLVIS